MKSHKELCRFARFVLLFIPLLLFGVPASASELSAPSIAVFHGKFHESGDLSGVAAVGNYLVVASDEGHVIQILEKTGPATFVLKGKHSLPDGLKTDRTEKEDPEWDLEGVAADGNTVYVVGSHSRKRSKVLIRNEKQRTYADNRGRLKESKKEEDRRILVRFKLKPNGEIDGDVSTKDKELWDAIQGFDELKPFTRIPSKENGIDIEGIAAVDDLLYIGFRGPVIRENWVPVMVTTFDNPAQDPKLHFVNLGGLGIRDLVSVGDGRFLILAGPVGDGPGGYQLYCWNGKDCVPGKNGAEGFVQHVGVIHADNQEKAEGLTVVGRDNDLLRLLVVFDGPERGDPKLYSLRINP